MILLLGVPLCLANGWVGPHVDEAGAVSSADFRAAYVLGPDSTTAVIQSGVDTDVRRFAWLLPVPAPLVQDRVAKVAPEVMDALIAGTDPRYTWTTGCGLNLAGMYGCRADGTDTAASAGVDLLRELDVGPYEVAVLDAKVGADVTGWLADHGYRVSAELEPVLDGYLAEGWILLAVALDLEELPLGSGALPALAFTYQSTKVAYPIRISAGSANSEVETVVFTIGPTATAPQGEAWVVPEVGQDFVGDDFAAWYQGVARAALARQQGRAWLLEYSRYGQGIYDDQRRWTTDDAALDLISALTELELIEADRMEGGAVLTRYRTWLSPAQMETDLVLVPDDTVPETVLELHGFQEALLKFLPLLVWPLRRRRVAPRRVSTEGGPTERGPTEGGPTERGLHSGPVVPP